MFVMKGLTETKRMLHTVQRALPESENSESIHQIENNYTVTEFPSKFWWGRLAVAVAT